MPQTSPSTNSRISAMLLCTPKQEHATELSVLGYFTRAAVTLGHQPAAQTQRWAPLQPHGTSQQQPHAIFPS